MTPANFSKIIKKAQYVINGLASLSEQKTKLPFLGIDNEFIRVLHLRGKKLYEQSRVRDANGKWLFQGLNKLARERKWVVDPDLLIYTLNDEDKCEQRTRNMLICLLVFLTHLAMKYKKDEKNMPIPGKFADRAAISVSCIMRAMETNDGSYLLEDQGDGNSCCTEIKSDLPTAALCMRIIFSDSERQKLAQFLTPTPETPCHTEPKP